MRRKRAPLEYRYWNGLCIWREDTQPPPWGNQVWAGLVTSRARVRLSREINRILRFGGRVLYVDTDSIIFQGRGPTYPVKAVRAGDFELRGRYRKVWIVGKKEYALEKENGEWEYQVKGVPAGARMAYLASGEATFNRPTRLREAWKTGEAPNVWHPHSKKRHVNLVSRSAPDGTLAVPWIDRGGQITFRHDAEGKDHEQGEG